MRRVAILIATFVVFAGALRAASDAYAHHGHKTLAGPGRAQLEPSQPTAWGRSPRRAHGTTLTPRSTAKGRAGSAASSQRARAVAR